MGVMDITPRPVTQEGVSLLLSSLRKSTWVILAGLYP